ncbi:hypothetical protein [Leifsonia sp. NPDC058248]|uniref:aldose epimerase family protein n=1 Tax=Leifsonia sp. NPDC058248 TaxID=3346402 RepID=UPI0036DB3E0B
MEAVISPLAASLRRLTVGGRDLVEPTDLAPGLPGMSGAMLAPWPNRVDGAVWWQGEHRHELEVSEPELGNANHGLLAGSRFDVRHSRADAVELTAAIRRPAGYPFDLDVGVTYRLHDAGINVTTAVTNVGPAPAPVALGAHPYLRVGDAPTEVLTLTLDASHAYRLDARHIPRERFDVTGTEWDLRGPTPVTSVPAHATFEREAATGRVVHTLSAPGGERVELSADPDYRWTQLYLAPDFPSAEGHRLAVAVEPMTAPPNALRTGEGIHWLQPDETWRVAWGLRFVE